MHQILTDLIEFYQAAQNTHCESCDNSGPLNFTSLKCRIFLKNAAEILSILSLFE